MSSILPEQGGFNEKLDEVLGDCIQPDPGYFDFEKAKAAIRTLVLEEIIGEDRPYEDERSAKILKMEQRKKLEDTHGTK